MKIELQNKLFDKYPQIFRQKDLSMNQTCMCWGIECEDGWYKLLDFLCSQLQFNTDRNNYPQVEARQVKEKFGLLRFYYESISNNIEDKYLERKFGEINGLISFAESYSEFICEKCGSIENVTQTKGWISTLCENCMNERNNYE